MPREQGKQRVVGISNSNNPMMALSTVVYNTTVNGTRVYSIRLTLEPYLIAKWFPALGSQMFLD